MPQPRRNQVSLVDTPYYHCVTRCVRRSFLCGVAAAVWTVIRGKVMSRGSVEKRLLFLSTLFAIDSAATVSVPMR
jgi:hypothetical protein